MNYSDPSFGDCLFELTNLMRAKGNVGIISDIISEAIRIHKGNHCDDRLSNELPLQELINHKMILNMDTMMKMMIVTMILMMQ